MVTCTDRDRQEWVDRETVNIVKWVWGEENGCTNTQNGWGGVGGGFSFPVNG